MNRSGKAVYGGLTGVAFDLVVRQFDLLLASTIRASVPVASLAHRDDIAQGVGTTGTSPVHFPFTSENGIAASSVMAARFHGAFAPSPGSFAYFVTECHVLLLSFVQLRCCWGLLFTCFFLVGRHQCVRIRDLQFALMLVVITAKRVDVPLLIRTPATLLDVCPNQVRFHATTSRA
jgi:hypothetical protein